MFAAAELCMPCGCERVFDNPKLFLIPFLGSYLSCCLYIAPSAVLFFILFQSSFLSSSPLFDFYCSSVMSSARLPLNPLFPTPVSHFVQILFGARSRRRCYPGLLLWRRRCIDPRQEIDAIRRRLARRQLAGRPHVGSRREAGRLGFAPAGAPALECDKAGKEWEEGEVALGV